MPLILTLCPTTTGLVLPPCRIGTVDIVIGSGVDVDVRLPDSQGKIAPRQCQIGCREGIYLIVDLGGFGTRLNDRPLDRPQRLSPGDRIGVGPYELAVAPADSAPNEGQAGSPVDALLAAAQPPAEAGAPVSVAAEPLFADIVARSQSLKSIVDGWSTSGEADHPGFLNGPVFTQFRAQATALAELDMQGHVVLRERGTDGDLKCILRGISEDMPRKIQAVETAADAAARASALSELAYLLNDNAEVILAPPQPAV